MQITGCDTFLDRALLKSAAARKIAVAVLAAGSLVCELRRR